MARKQGVFWLPPAMTGDLADRPLALAGNNEPPFNSPAPTLISCSASASSRSPRAAESFRSQDSTVTVRRTSAPNCDVPRAAARLCHGYIRCATVHASLRASNDVPNSGYSEPTGLLRRLLARPARTELRAVPPLKQRPVMGPITPPYRSVGVSWKAGVQPGSTNPHNWETHDPSRGVCLFKQET